MFKRMTFFLGVVVLLVVVLGVIDIVLLTTPEQLRAQLAEEISRQLDADLELDFIDHTPFSTKVHITNMRLKSRGQNAREFFSAEKTVLTLNYFSFLGGSSLEYALFENPVVTVYGGEEDVLGRDTDLIKSLREGDIPKLKFEDATLRFVPEDGSEPATFPGLDLEVDPAAMGGMNSLEFSYVFESDKRLRIRAEIDTETGAVTISSVGEERNYLCLDYQLHDLLGRLSQGKEDFAFQVLDMWDYLGAAGDIEVDSLRITYDPSKPAPDCCSCEGRFFLCDVSMKLKEFPYRLVRMSGQVDISGGDVTLSKMQAFNDRGEGHLQGSGTIKDFLSLDPDLELTLAARNIPLDDKLREALKVDADVLEMWDAINPRGYSARLADSTIAISKAPGQKWSSVEVMVNFDGRAGAAYTLTDADGEGKALEVSKVSGKVRFSEESIDIDAQAEIAGVLVKVPGGWIKRPGMPDSEMNIIASAEDFEVTEKIRRLLPAEMRREMESIDITKTIDLTLSLTRKKGQPEPSLRVEVSPRKAVLSYKGVPYRLEDVEGSVVYDGDRIEFRNLRGRHGEAVLRASGGISDLSGEPVCDIEVHGENVLLDTDLYAALPPDVREVWDEYVPKSVLEEGGAGRVKIDCRIKGRAEQPDIMVDAHVTDGTVKCVHFPYLVKDVSGLLRIKPEGVYLEGLRGTHGSVQVSLDRGKILDGEVDVTIVGKDVLLEKELRDALDEEFRKAYDLLQPKGSVGVLVRLTQKGEQELETEVTITSDGTLEFTYKEFPLPATEVVTEIFIGPKSAEVKKFGCKLGKAAIPLDEEKPNNCFIPFDAPRFRMNISRVEGLHIDEELKSALPEELRKALDKIEACGGVDLEDVSVDFLTEEQRGRYEYSFKAVLRNCSLGDRPLIDKLNGTMDLRIVNVPGEYTSAEGSSFSNLDFYVRGIHISGLTGQVRRRDAKEVQFSNPADPHTVEFAANAYGPKGKSNMTGHFTFCLGESKEYEGAFDFRGVDLAEMESDLSGKPAKMKGVMSGNAAFRGEGENLANLAGSGSLDIENGDLGTLPVLFGLNQLLKGDLPKTQVVSEGHLRFEIKDEVFDFKKVEFKSQAVRFIGYGQIKFDETIRMTICSDTVLRGIPFLDGILGVLKKRINAAEVKGTFAKPEIGPAPLLRRITDIPEDVRKALARED